MLVILTIPQTPSAVSCQLLHTALSIGLHFVELRKPGVCGFEPLGAVRLVGCPRKGKPSFVLGFVIQHRDPGMSASSVLGLQTCANAPA